MAYSSAVPEQMTRPRGPDGAFLPAAPAAPVDDTPAWARGLIDRMDRLEDRVKDAATRAPAFRPMAPPTNHRGPTGIFAGMNPGAGRAIEREGVSKQILVDERGDKVSQMILAQYPPRFEAGDPCRIDPDSSRPGFPEGQTWGHILERLKVDGVGQVKKVYWLRDTGEWKYSAVVRGVTNQRPDGFLDSELLPL